MIISSMNVLKDYFIFKNNKIYNYIRSIMVDKQRSLLNGLLIFFN